NYLLIFLFFLGIAIISFMHSDIDQEMSEESKMLYGFAAREGKELGKKYGMSFSGVGGGTDHGIWFITVCFQHYDSFFTEERARKLIIDCLQEFLEIANKDEALRPFLKVYPLKPENINMNIFNYTNDHNFIFYPYICTVSTSDGEIGLFTKDSSDIFRY